MLFAATGFPAESGFMKLPAEAEVGPMSAVRVDRTRGLIYVLHRGGTPLLRFDAKGNYLGGWGAGLFKVPHGLRIDREGNVWITDNGLNTVQKFSPTGQLLVTLKEANGPLRAPDDLVFNSRGDIYIADTGNSRIVHLSPDGKFIAQWGKKGKGPGEFATAHSMDIDDAGRIYVADRGNNRVQLFAPDGTFDAEWTGFGNPFGVLVCKPTCWFPRATSTRSLTWIRMERESRLGSASGGAGAAASHGCSTDGTLFVSEVNGKRVQIFRLGGK